MSWGRWFLVVVFVLAIGFAGGFVAVQETSARSSGGEVTVDHATLLPGEIVLTLESPSNEAVVIAQTIVNDAYVDFDAGTPGAADVSIDYPWIEGESYEIEMLTTSGASIDYELEDAEAA